MPEKTINEIAPDMRRLHTKAVEAAQRDNTDYAITLYCQILEREPGFYECRKALRAEQFKKASAGGGGFFKKMMSSAGSSPQIAKAKMALNKNPVEAMAVAEQVLVSDPTNASAHRIIADAAVALDMPKTRILELEAMAKNAPKDKAIVIEFAEAVGETGSNADVAEKLLNDLIKNSAYDTDLLQVRKNLSAHKTMDEGGYGALEDGKGSYRDILRNKDEAVSLEQEKRVHKSEDVTERLINEYETRLQTETDNQKVMRSLAELYTQKSRFDDALAVYERIKNLGMATDSSLDRAIAETTAKKFDQAIAAINPFTDDHAQQLAKLQADKFSFQLAETQKRVEKYPTDLGFKFELGVLYFKTGKTMEAIGEFQKAQQNPHKRIQA
ncbi:MAG TPA: hypothetical protein VG347_11670, partial [Verrucomicrobiae bacterium]|nr:hypothetical protein [Verrucomicrobiae bacterium]